MVQEHLKPELNVLDVGCGHGEAPLTIAPFVHHVLAYDRVPSYIEMARTAAAERHIPNVTFLCYDSSTNVHETPRIPADDHSFDLLISRRGPLHWLEDARRVARPGAALLQLNPMETPLPPWNSELPEALRRPAPGDWTMRGAVERKLALGRLSLHSCWTFDVPEWFDDPEQFYLFLSWGFAPEEVPTFAELRETLESIFGRYGRSNGLALRHCRFLWKAVVD
jgi:SAM-dependent methyltransferase